MTIEEREGLPEGWLETTLGEVVAYGQTQKAEPEEIPDDAWVLELEDIERDSSKILNRETFGQRESKSTKNIFNVGDILYGKLRPYLNKIIIADQNGYCTTEIIPIKPGGDLESRFIFYWLKHPEFLDYVTKVSHGMNMPRLGTEAGKEAPFLLTSLAEQIRIADKLDALLSRVDAGRERLERVPKLVKRFRQSVLSAAVSGELTREWRGGGESQIVSLKQVLKEIKTGPFGSALHQSDYISDGIPVINPIHINNGLLTANSSVSISIQKARELQDFKMLPGGIIIGRRGVMGRCAVIKSEHVGWLCGTGSMMLYPKPELFAEYLSLFLRSPETVQVLEADAVGSTMINLNQKILLELEMLLPSLPEQAEIVRRVEALFALADRLEARAQAALARYSRLTPALLAKAFRGELVPQDPADEPASVLLERIKAQREAAGPVKKAAGRGRRPGATTPTAESGAGAGEAQPEPKRGRGRPRKVQEGAGQPEQGQTSRGIPVDASAEEAIRLLQERARAEREGKQAVQAGLFGDDGYD